MRKMYEYRIYPTKKQETLLRQALEECRWLYNHLLASRKETYEQTGKGLTLYQQQETFSILKKEETALAKVQRKHSKLAKGTPQRRKHCKAVARVHERIAFRRDNFTHQVSRRLVDSFGVICVEELHINLMTHNHCLAKSIHDASWSEFFNKLAAKAGEARRKYIAVNPAYTSQDCSRCHHRQVMPLSERTYDCPCCLLSIDRDLNAALNIRALGLQGLGLSVEAPGFIRGE